MGDRPFVSLVIVNHNGRAYLEELLPSVMRQEGDDLPAWETIVVDNASWDDSVPWLARTHPDVRLLRNRRNEGFAGPANRGAAAARGEWVAFLNNDMTLHPAWLATMARAARAGRADALSGKVLDREGRRIQFGGSGLGYCGVGYGVGHGAPAEEEPAAATDLLFPCGAAMWVRRDVFLDAGGFDSDYFAYYEDVDLGWRLRLFGRRITMVPEALSYHRHQGTAARSDRARIFYHTERNMLYTLIKNLEERNLYRALAAALLLLHRRAMMEYPFPFPDVSFPEEKPPPARPPDRSPRGLWRKLRRRLSLLASVPYAESLSRLRAMDAVLERAGPLWEKRRLVQARRVVSDAALFPLFGDPLYTPWEDPGYVRCHRLLFDLFGFDAVFSASRAEKGP